MISIEGKLAFIESEKVIVVGDLHGDYDSFLKTKEFLEEDDYIIIYLGDYADRGSSGVEIIEDLIKIREKFRNRILALKGNHENYNKYGYPNFYPCDLIREVELKRGDWREYYEKTLKNFFDSLPLSAINEKMKMFFVHGGISSGIKSLENLKYPSKRIEECLIWSDPIEEYGEFYNPRGAGVLFGYNVTNNFCIKFGVEKIVRSHEPRKALYSPVYEHNNKVITISSTRVYGGRPHILKIEEGKIETIYLD
ncbi:MAG: metallophosphoesterase family protein [Candidatus Aenigmatarchaeota archaeon]